MSGPRTAKTTAKAFVCWPSSHDWLTGLSSTVRWSPVPIIEWDMSGARPAPITPMGRIDPDSPWIMLVDGVGTIMPDGLAIRGSDIALWFERQGKAA